MSKKSEEIPIAAFSYRNGLLELMAGGKLSLEEAAAKIRQAALVKDEKGFLAGWDINKEKLLSMAMTLLNQKQTPPDNPET